MYADPKVKEIYGYHGRIVETENGAFHNGAYLLIQTEEGFSWEPLHFDSGVNHPELFSGLFETEADALRSIENYDSEESQ